MCDCELGKYSQREYDQLIKLINMSGLSEGNVEVLIDCVDALLDAYSEDNKRSEEEIIERYNQSLIDQKYEYSPD